jgi:hypothetical protein
VLFTFIIYDSYNNSDKLRVSSFRWRSFGLKTLVSTKRFCSL